MGKCIYLTKMLFCIITLIMNFVLKGEHFCQCRENWFVYTKYIDMFQQLIIINMNSNFFSLVKWCTIWTQNKA